MMLMSKNFCSRSSIPNGGKIPLSFWNCLNSGSEKNQKWGGDSIVGFGKYRYQYKTGHSGEWPVTGFSPRKQNLPLYIITGFNGEEELLSSLGKHRLGKSCLYINKLEDVDLEVLGQLVRKSIAEMEKRYEIVS